MSNEEDDRFLNSLDADIGVNAISAAWAGQVWALYLDLVREGFKPEQALYLIGIAISGQGVGR